MNTSEDRAVGAHGLSPLHIAVIRGDTRHARRILSHSISNDLINARDAGGTTPLMTAVATGRRDIAQLLLQHGASAAAKDCRGHKALDYSRPSLFQSKLDIYRRLGFPPLTPKQLAKRRSIAQILRQSAALRSCLRAGKHECSQSVFYKRGGTLRVLNPDVTFLIGKDDLERATCGFIASATRPDVKTAAVSGWQPNPHRGSNVLDNAKYIGLVQGAANVLGFELRTSQYDNNAKHLPEHRGRFVSSHTEKKLAVFWVIAALKAVCNTTDLTRIGELRDAGIPEAWRTAHIFLDHIPCDNCWQYLAAIKRATGLEILVERRPFLVTGHRQGPAGCKKCHCERCKKKFGDQRAQAPPVGSEGRDGADADESQDETGSRTSGEGIHECDTEAITGAVVEASSQEPDRQRVRGDVGEQDVQPKGCKPPKKWRHYRDRKTGEVYAKPLPRCSKPQRSDFRPSPISKSARALEIAQASGSQSASGSESSATSLPSNSPPTNNTGELREPISTIAGRSGFFATPEPFPVLEVQIPQMHPCLRREYDRLSDSSGPLSGSQPSGTSKSGSARSKTKQPGKKRRQTIQQSAATLNLGQFLYDGSRLSATGASMSREVTNRGRQRKKAVVSGGATRGTVKRARTRVGRDEKLRAKSAFARAVEHHERKRAGKA